MDIVAWVIVGVAAGWLAAILMNVDGYALLSNIIVGVIGAFLGGYVAGALFNIPLSGLRPAAMLISLAGAFILIALLKILNEAEVT